ncbi:hypothetical protein GCM10023085_12020 [Actinomadura viridis]|uniref:Pyridoxamine 5'-phosphate oxidase n=1 Tax=Actinomadura viridis TaxID=58110 RepID=A0A931DPR9_9ACTN|nr:pyridoxamine 5'-phosphate oxidase family protein [Actinomadura viridis]MBG6093577.1 hypothetical protein [Actinomadura viridis]
MNADDPSHRTEPVPERDPDPAPMVLSWRQAMDRLASARVGRLVFTERGLPAVRVVRYRVRGGTVRLDLDDGAGLTMALREAPAYDGVVALHADGLGEPPGGGWEVTAVGVVRTVETGGGGTAVLIDVRHVTGHRITFRPAGPPCPPSPSPPARTAAGARPERGPRGHLRAL